MRRIRRRMERIGLIRVRRMVIWRSMKGIRMIRWRLWIWREERIRD